MALRAEAALCRVLGDPTRLSIVVALAGGPVAVGDICQRLGLPQSTASGHLESCATMRWSWRHGMRNASCTP